MRGPRPKKTDSFFEGENRMTFDVAGQELTGTETGHPFLHPGDSGGNQPKAGQTRSFSVKVRQNCSHLQSLSDVLGVTAGQKDGQRRVMASRAGK